MKGLLIPVSGPPEILNDSLEKVKLIVFYNREPVISTFNSHCNYYRYNDIDSITQPVNVAATFFKRLYTHRYSIKNIVRGDVLVYSSFDKLPNVIDYSVPQYFVDQVASYYISDVNVF